MFKYQLGDVIDSFKNNQEGVKFDIADDGAMMIVFFKNPSSTEIAQFKADSRFEIRFTELHDIVMITAKIGNLAWMDAPYTPHLSQHLTTFQLPQENEGLALTLILIDSATGEIMNMRLIGLSEKFSKKLLGTVMDLKMKSFNEQDYNTALSRIYSSYSTNQLLKMSSDYCKIG